MVRTIASSLLVDAGNHRHYMAKEIHEQPEVVGHTLAHYLDFANARVKLPADFTADFAALDRLSITACGTAFYAGLVAKYWFERLARLPVDIDIASEFRYREQPLPKGPGDRRLAVGRDRRHARLAPLRQGAGAEGGGGGQRAAPRPSRARPTSSCRRLPARKSASLRPRPSPASSRCSPCSRSPPAGRADMHRRR